MPFRQHANALLEAKLGRRVGHKIGGTTEAMRRYINVPEPLAGEVFAAQVHADGATVRRTDFVRLGIETEIAVRLGGDLPARDLPYGRDEVANAVASFHAAIELVDDRYVDFATIGGPTQIADNAFDAGSVLGEPVTDWRNLDLGGLTARTFREGALIASGLSDALLGHPLDALAWLANRRARLGWGLAAGAFVTLGTTHDHARGVGERAGRVPHRGRKSRWRRRPRALTERALGQLSTTSPSRYRFQLPTYRNEPRRIRSACSGRTSPTTFPGTPITTELSGISLFSPTKALAAIRQFLPTRAPLSTTAPIPIRLPSPMTQPCSMAMWPTVTCGPISSGVPGSV